LTVNDVHLSLNDVNPKIAVSIGSTKDNQFAVASGGKVFALGPLSPSAGNGGDYLAVVPQTGDEAFLVTRHSALSWPTPFDFNFIICYLSWLKWHLFFVFRCNKSFGAHTLI